MNIYIYMYMDSCGWAKAGQPTRTYIQQLCAKIGCSPEDLPEAMDDREGWQERVRDICANGTTWWWWWYIWICVCGSVCGQRDYLWHLWISAGVSGRPILCLFWQKDHTKSCAPVNRRDWKKKDEGCRELGMRLQSREPGWCWSVGSKTWV